MNDRLNIAYAVVRYRLFPPVIRTDNDRVWWPESLISTPARVIYAHITALAFGIGVAVLFNFTDLSIQTMPLVILYASVLCVGCTLVLSVALAFLLICKIYDLHQVQYFKKQWVLFQDWRLRCGQGNF